MYIHLEAHASCTRSEHFLPFRILKPERDWLADNCGRDLSNGGRCLALIMVRLSSPLVRHQRLPKIPVVCCFSPSLGLVLSTR